MIRRVHITAFAGLTIASWLVILAIQGQSVVRIEFIKPFGTVVGILGITMALFAQYAWSWKLFRGWFIERPDLRGTWKVEMRSNWTAGDSSKPTTPIIAYAAVKQTLYTLSIRLLTEESQSSLVAHSFSKENDGIFRLTAVYRNEPNIRLQEQRSRIHYGAISLEVHCGEEASMQGHYWTDRCTNGIIEFTERVDEHLETYEIAQRRYERP